MTESTVAELHPSGRLSRGEYIREREAIRETYGDSPTEAAAKRDQALARLFTRSGWTQEQLAEVEGKSQQRIAEILRFGRFLEFTGSTGISINHVTESRFNGKSGYWRRTDSSETNERIRFQEVIRLIEDSTLAAPRHRAIRSMLVQQFGDGKWHRPGTMATHIDTTEDHVTRILNELSWPSNSRTAFKVERKKVGKHHEYRIFKKERTISTDELTEKLTPIIEELQEMSERAPGTMSNPTVARIAAQIRNLLKEWRE